MATTLFRVTLKGKAAGEDVANVLYFERGDGITLAAMLSAIDTNWCAWAANVMSGGASYESITAQQVGHLLLDPEYGILVNQHVGARTAEPHTDPQMAVCFSLGTGLSGKRRRGRVFQFGTSDEWVENGKLTSAGLSAWNDFWTVRAAPAFMGSSPTSGCKLVVFSKTIFNGLSDIFSDSYKPVTSHLVHQTLSTMRSRKPSST